MAGNCSVAWRRDASPGEGEEEVRVDSKTLLSNPSPYPSLPGERRDRICADIATDLRRTHNILWPAGPRTPSNCVIFRL